MRIPLLGPNQGVRIKPLEEHTLIHGVRIKPLEQHTLIREPELVRIPLLETNHRVQIKCHLNSTPRFWGARTGAYSIVRDKP